MGDSVTLDVFFLRWICPCQPVTATTSCTEELLCRTAYRRKHTPLNQIVCTKDVQKYSRVTWVKSISFHLFWTFEFFFTPYFLYRKRAEKNVSSYVGRKDWRVWNEDLSRPASYLHLWLTQETRNTANLALPLSVVPTCICFSKDNSFCVFWIWLPLITLQSLLMTLQSCMEKSGAFGRQHAAFWHYQRWQFSFYFQTACECSPFPGHPWFCRHLPHPHITPFPVWRAWGYPFIPCMEAGLHTLVIFNHKTHSI